MEPNHKIIKAPFTEDQVKNLNAWQRLGFVHEYTCANEHGGERALVATKEGFQCPTCKYLQVWAHESSSHVKKYIEEFNKSDFGKFQPVEVPKELL